LESCFLERKKDVEIGRIIEFKAETVDIYR